MDISVELTLLPLQDDYETPIINFIKALRESKFRVVETALSTQVFGDYDELMSFLTQQIKTSFENFDLGLLHIKLVKTDLSDYEPHF